MSLHNNSPNKTLETATLKFPHRIHDYSKLAEIFIIRMSSVNWETVPKEGQGLEKKTL